MKACVWVAWVVVASSPLAAQAPDAGEAEVDEADEAEAGAGDSDAEPVEADPTRAMLAEAVNEYGAGAYAEAYALLLRAHEMRPSARVQRFLGMAAFELRNYREAIDWLERSLVTRESPLTDDMRASVDALLERARSYLGTFEVRTNVPARIDVDGEPAEGDTLVLDLGDHDIVAHAEGYEVTTRRVHVRGGEREVIEIELVRLVAHTTEEDDPGALHRRIGIASLASAGVFLVTGIGATVIWADAVSTLNLNLREGACAADPDSESILPGGAAACYDQENRYRLALPFIWIGYVGAGALLATGIALFAVAPGEDDDGVSFSCGPFAELGVGCSGRF